MSDSDVLLSSSEDDVRSGDEKAASATLSVRTVSVVPYAHEPPQQRRTSLQRETRQRKVQGYPDREGNLWCQCGHCCPQDNPANRYCCKEQPKITQKLDEWLGDLSCITQHPGYTNLTEDVFVLQVAYLEYKSRYHTIEAPLDKKYRYTAYRQFIRWVWQKLGKDNRQPLPSCVMHRIHTVFPSIDGIYTGFRFVPDL